MSKSSSDLSYLPNELTLCENVVKNDNYQDSIDFFVVHSITSLKSLKANEFPLATDLKFYMGTIAPKYTASQNEQGTYIVRKYFDHNVNYKDLPVVEFYQSFQKAAIENNLVSDDYFKNYEQAKLDIMQNLLTEANIVSVAYEEGNFCRIIDFHDFKPVECIGGECIRSDVTSSGAHQEL